MWSKRSAFKPSWLSIAIVLSIDNMIQIGLPVVGLVHKILRPSVAPSVRFGALQPQAFEPQNPIQNLELPYTCTVHGISRCLYLSMLIIIFTIYA